MKNILDIIGKLGINKENGLFITSEDLWKKECRFSSRIVRLIGNRLNPDAFFIFDNKPLILFYENPKNTKDIHKALWNFNESPIVIFAFDSKIEVFNGFTYLTEKSELQFIGNEECLNDFNYFEIVTGRTWEKYQSELLYENRVDFKLLKNIRVTREILINEHKLEASIANALIGKIIFVRYLIDREVKIGYGNKSGYLTNEYLCSILSIKENAIKFFKYLEKKFNGDMFLLKDKEYQSITDRCFETIINLLNEDDLGYGQKSFFKLYDFAIIPIEFISNVYESFIGNQEEDSAYYTPLFLVDYILSETVETYLSSNQKTYNCRVLDPACGSGIFLVETLRKIIEKFISLNPNIKEDSEEFKNVLKQLAVDNIFGIDKNLSAIQVAIFSLQLTLLDYQEPPSIENFKFPKLLNTNFFEADFFNTTHKYNEIFKKNRLNFIIGNPPWKRGKGEKSPLFVEYIKERNKREKKENLKAENQIAISNKEIAQAFLLRVSDFSIVNSVSLIVTSKVLYNLNGKKFRQYFLNNFEIQKVFELAPVRHHVFDKSKDPAIAPAAILFYRPAINQNTSKNIIKYISLKPSSFFKLFKIFSLYRSDFKEVQQLMLKQYDWLWKIMVYGSYLDFNLINRLKTNYSSIENELQDETRYIKGQGVMVGGGDDNDASHLIGKPFLNTSRDIKPFWINEDIANIWENKIAHRPRKEILYTAPMLLITGGISNEFKSVSAISNKDLVFRSSLTAIKAINKKDVAQLKVMSALLNSSFFSYYALQTFSSSGIEREESHDDEKWTIPYSYSPKIEKLYDELQEQYSELHSIKINATPSLNQKISRGKAKLIKEILSTFNFSKSETALIDYAINVVIPVQMQHTGFEKHFEPVKIGDSGIESYAQLFIDRFSVPLNTKKQQFIVEIWHSKQIIGMFFKVVPQNKSQQSIIWENKAKEKVLSKATELSSQKITDKLFVQKDLRGFEKDFFYIFKPNEKRLWHKAIGYQDVDEFMDAILKTNRRTYGRK
ncbi:MAG: DNA methyltransferase [Bacteroidales bacterium]